MSDLMSFLGLVALVGAIWVIYDVLTYHKKFSTEKKVIWIVCAVLFSIITAIIYYLVVKKK
jgi:prolipoprotein diacylglyceryltransferase